MNTASALLSIGIALVFILSAAGKLRALDAAEATLRALRLPTIAARPAIVGLTIVELLVAATLFLPHPISAIAATASVVLALCFLISVVRAYLLGSREDCGCFGAGESPISLRLILRNVALLAATVMLAVLAWQGAGVFAALIASDALLSLFTVLAAALLAAVLWLSLGPHASERDAEPDVTTDPDRPHIVLLEQTSGIPRDITAAASWRAQLLVFVKPGCGSCDEVIAELDGRTDALSRVASFSLIVGSPAGHSPQELLDDRFLLDPADLNARRIGVGERRPVAALLATDGSIVRPLAHGRDEIVQLLDALQQAADT